MKVKAYILVMIFGCFMLHGCQKNIDIFVPDPGQPNGPDTSWYNTVTASMPVTSLKNNLLQDAYTDTIMVDAATANITTPAGVRLTFPPHCCVNAAGQLVTGKVDVEVQLVKKKGDMIRQNRPSTFNDSLLTTAGEIFIRLKKEGQALQLAPNARISIRYADLPINPLVKFFIGDETNAERFNWLPTPTPSADTIIVGTQAYEILTRRLRWINIGALYDAANSVAKVTVAADMETHFTNANTIAFTVFKDMYSVAAMHAEVSSRKFVSSKLPVGKEITVVVISKMGNDYYLGYTPAVTQTPSSIPLIQHVRVAPVKRSLAEILSYLNSL